jgi:hypothetical protein
MLKSKLDYVSYPILHKPFEMIDEVVLNAAQDFESRIREVEDAA